MSHSQISFETTSSLDDTRARNTIRYKYIYLCVLYFLNSMERGIIPTNLKEIQDDIKLNDPAKGQSLNSFFIGGLLFAIPVFAVLENRTKKTFTLLSIGLLIWLGATFASGFCQSYEQMVLARIFSGAGDAAFQVLGGPWIDLNAPSNSRASWLTLFISIYGLGSAAGLILSSPEIMGNWRNCFKYYPFLIGVPVLVGFFLDKKRTAVPSDQAPLTGADNLSSQTSKQMVQGLCKVLFNPLVVLAVMGSAGFQAVVAIIGYNAPLHSYSNLNLYEPCQQFPDGSQELQQCMQSKAFDAVSLISVALLAGMFAGSIVGGKGLDMMGQKYGGKTVTMAFNQAVVGMILGTPVLMLAFLVTSLGAYAALLAVALAFLMAGGAGFSSGAMWIVDRELRVYVAALNLLIFNLLGSVPGPVVVGMIQKELHPTDEDTIDNQILAFSSFWLVVPIFSWLAVAIIAKRRGIGQNVDEENIEENRRNWKAQLRSNFSMSTSISTIASLPLYRSGMM